VRGLSGRTKKKQTVIVRPAWSGSLGQMASAQNHPPAQVPAHRYGQGPPFVARALCARRALRRAAHRMQQYGPPGAGKPVSIASARAGTSLAREKHSGQRRANTCAEQKTRQTKFFFNLRAGKRLKKNF